MHATATCKNISSTAFPTSAQDCVPKVPNPTSIVRKMSVFTYPEGV